MMHEFVSVFDHVAGVWSRPFGVRTTGEAVRSFMDECRNPQAALGAHPGDYELFHVGTFDDVTGLMSQLGPTTLMHGRNVMPIEKREE